MKKTLTLAALLAVAFANPAEAKKHAKKHSKKDAVECPAKTSMPATAMAAVAGSEAGKIDMSGFYLGASLGAANTQDTVLFSSAAGNQNYKQNAGKFSPYYDFILGYNHHMGSMLLGAELTVSYDTNNFKPWNDDSTAGYPVTRIKKGFSYGLAARLGYNLTAATNLYVKLGLTRVKYQLSASTSAKAAFAKRTFTTSKTAMLFTPGLGMETFFSSNMFGRMEYTFVAKKKVGYENEAGLWSSAVATASSSNSLSQHIVKATVGYKF